MVANDSIRVCGPIVKQVHECLHGGLGAGGLLGGQGAKRDKHGRIHSMGIVEEDTNDFLDTFVVGSIKHGSVVRVRGELDFCAIIGALPCMWGHVLGVRDGDGETGGGCIQYSPAWRC